MAISSAYHKTRADILEEEQVIAAANRDPKHFEPLYRSYYEPIFRFVYKRLDSMDQAQDVTSQVFLKALTNLKKYQSRGLPFGSWLYRIAISEVNNMYKANKATRALNIDTVNLNHMMQEMEEDQSEEHRQLLVQGLRHLKEEDLALVEMRFFEKRPFKEIGEILGITENNAKVRLYRALDRLKKTVTTTDQPQAGNGQENNKTTR